ncbi:uncharacterized protein LOC129732113 isoform X2 [Wyeomyia smithii]|uniref:uncharacterized protein LOC129732113 isoform X2 n=1 Tax=Wyeomyia smithii TaxID=174621 RepID=UPI002467C65D|nr:uncharacterized protein LOC129732113 isoform X2 [Wyeomyia smithii]
MLGKSKGKVIYLCSVAQCPSKYVKNRSGNLSFHRWPDPSRTSIPHLRHLAGLRLSAWNKFAKSLSIPPKNKRICGKHFVSGKPAKTTDTACVDWVPSLCLPDHDYCVEAAEPLAEAFLDSLIEETALDLPEVKYDPLAVPNNDWMETYEYHDENSTAAETSSSFETETSSETEYWESNRQNSIAVQATCSVRSHATQTEGTTDFENSIILHQTKKIKRMQKTIDAQSREIAELKKSLLSLMNTTAFENGTPQATLLITAPPLLWPITDAQGGASTPRTLTHDPFINGPAPTALLPHAMEGVIPEIFRLRKSPGVG